MKNGRKQLTRALCLLLAASFLTVSALSEETPSAGNPADEMVLQYASSSTDELAELEQMILAENTGTDIQVMSIEDTDGAQASDAAPTEEPAETEAPAGEATEEPAETEAPVGEATEEPAEAEAPAGEATEKPAETEVPDAEATQEPAATETPSEVFSENVESDVAAAQDVWVRILKDATPLFINENMQQVVAEASVGDLFAVIENKDTVLCVEYVDEAQSRIPVYVLASNIEWVHDEAQREMDMPVLAGASGNGSFYLAAHSGGEWVIKPTEVYFGAGDTILSALGRLNGHSIQDLSTGEVTQIDGVQAYFTVNDEGGSCDMNRPASDIRAVAFADGAFPLTEEKLNLLGMMAEFAACADIQVELYQQALEVYITSSDEEAAQLAESLRKVMEGETIPVGDENAPEQKDGVYLIRTGGELKWFADMINGELSETESKSDANARLMCDVSISGLEWTPVGSAEIPYGGKFDGNGYTVSGLEISAQKDYQALFGYVEQTGMISNLTVSGSVDVGGSYAAGVVAYCKGSLMNVHNRCSVTASGRYIGGVVGAFSDGGCEANSCTNSGNIYASNETGTTWVGGILGGTAGTMVNCGNTGAVSGYDSVGGIAGQATEVRNCSNSGNVQCIRQFGGGIAGQVQSILKCENKGKVSSAGVYENRILGYEAQYIGGIVGLASQNVQNSINRGSISGHTGSGSVFSSVGGIAGRAASVTACFNYGDIAVAGKWIGGVVGGNGGAAVTRCANYAAVTNYSSSGVQTGGIASAGEISECCNFGEVKGSQTIGGIVGGSSVSSVKNCYNLGTVKGIKNVGGIAGECLIADWCYNAGTVYTEGTSGGLITAVYSNVKNCYYLDSLNLYSKVGEAVNTASLRLAMQKNSVFELNLNPEYQSGYPCLAWETGNISAEAQAIALSAGEKQKFTMEVNGAMPGLPKKVIVTAGGLEFLCPAEWIVPDGFDGSVPGEYMFFPDAALPKACLVGNNTSMQAVTVAVLQPEDLPKLSSVVLEENAPTDYTTDYGVEPDGFPTHALAVIDGVEQRIAVSWQAPTDIDFTNPEKSFVYTMVLDEAFAVEAGVEMPVITLRVKPLMLISELLFTEKSVKESAPYAVEYMGMSQEDTEVFRYRLKVFDHSKSIYLHLDLNENWSEDIGVKYKAISMNNPALGLEREYNHGQYNNLSGMVAGHKKGYNGSVTLTAAAEINGKTVTQKYIVETTIYPTLSAVDVSSEGAQAYLVPELDVKWMDYTAQLPSNARNAALQLTTMLSPLSVDGLEVQVNGESIPCDEKGIYKLELPVDEKGSDVQLALFYTDQNGSRTRTDYALHLGHIQETRLCVKTTPEDAVITVSNASAGKVFGDAENVFTLIRGFEYSYTASAPGYISQQGTVIAEGETMELTVDLQQAQSNDSIPEDMEAEWEGFRGNSGNNAVTGSPMPVDASDAVLYWANPVGTGYGKDAVGSPILVDGYLVCTASQSILKLDTVTGEVVQSGTMAKHSAFNIIPPLYTRGMIFVALSDGVIQAFNADTLESLWIYTDPLGGQPNSPITYRNGYIYTGFWNGETSDGNWVCIPVTDENPAKATEEKHAAWTHTQKGGFYWAGACAENGHMIVGTDNGSLYETESGKLLSLDQNSGRLIDCLDDLGSDIRSTVCYDSVTDRYYFTSKAGYFYSVQVTQDGYFIRESLKRVKLSSALSGEATTSTSTPVVYNGRAYVGYSKDGDRYAPYSGQAIAVIDLTSWTIAYSCPTRGYCQTSGVLTNAYEETGLVYVYFIDNMNPCSVYVIRDCPGQTQLLSVYDGSPIDKAEILFTTRGDQRQYALCSPIVDKYGTIYFKNDSGYMMAVGSKAARLEVEEKPSKYLYTEGEVFDPSGMRVLMHTANGAVKDVTQNVSWSKEPLTANDTDITLYFNHVLYNNDAEVLDPPQVAVNLVVLTASDMAVLRSVIEQIDALQNVTIDSEAAVIKARADYDAMDENLRELVSNYETLTRAEEEFALLAQAEALAAAETDRFILAIEAITLESAETLRRAFELYDTLAEYGKRLVKNYAVLLDYQKQYQDLIAGMDSGAAAVMQMIAELGEITLDSGDALKAARAAYDALDDASKANVMNISTLIAGETQYIELLAAQGASVRAVEELINYIGEVTLLREEFILLARENYDALDADAQAQVSNYDKLLAAEEALAALKELFEGMGETITQMDELRAHVLELAADAEQVNAENAEAIVPVIYQMYELVQQQPLEKQELLAEYTMFANQYRATVEKLLHVNADTGIIADGLEWYMKLQVEVLKSSADQDYTRFKSLISPKRLIKLYRITALDLITGEPAADHDTRKLNLNMLVPNYNKSGYSAIGIVRVGASSAAENLECAYADFETRLVFESAGDGLFGVVGTKKEMNVSGSVESSGSVLGGTGTSDAVQNGSGSGGSSSGGLNNYTASRKALLKQYENGLDAETWQYQPIVIQPKLAERLTDAQINLYQAMSRAVEEGDYQFFAHAVTEAEFELVRQSYVLCNPLSALADFTYMLEDGMVEVDYMLPEEEHLAAVQLWTEQIERIVGFALAAKDPMETAAQLYQYITGNFRISVLEWMPEADSDDAGFYPSAYYALMHNAAKGNDAAKAYAYLLMQAGIECIYVKEFQPAAEPEAAADEAAAEDIHVWVALKAADEWMHADAEFDLFNEANPDAELDVLGHFGMDDAERELGGMAEFGYEAVLPEIQKQLLSAEDYDWYSAVPLCSGSYEAHQVEEDVVYLEGEEV